VKNYDITEYRTKKKVFRFIPVREREKECVCVRENEKGVTIMGSFIVTL